MLFCLDIIIFNQMYVEESCHFGAKGLLNQISALFIKLVALFSQSIEVVIFSLS